MREKAPGFTEHMRWYGERHPELASLFPERVHSDGDEPPGVHSGAGGSAAPRPGPDVRPERVPERLRHPVDQPALPRPPLRIAGSGPGPDRQVRAGRVEHRHVRRQLQLARSDLVADESRCWSQGLRNLHRCYGDDFLVEYPTGSGQHLPLDQIADDLSRRLISIFLRGPDGRRPVFGGTEVMQTDPHWRDHILFYEYFHGDNGAGIGASHQTGWTAVVANLIDRDRGRCSAAAIGRHCRELRPG